MIVRPEITGRCIGKSLADIETLAVTFGVASQITGLGLTTLWKFGKEGRIRLIRPSGIRRTLIDYSSLRNLIVPNQTETLRHTPASRPHRRSRKLQAKEATP
jgi:hypothetical protein